MSPGRELDVLVAQKLMPERTGIVPHYSTAIGAAWDVVEKLWAQGLKVNLLTASNGRRVRCDVIRGILAEASEESDSAPSAICLAALKAVGVEVPA